jgi:LemA protein
MPIWLIVLIVVVVLVLLWVVVTYNGLVKLRNKVENAWAQIDVQLKRRLDLIPNVVEAVKGYAAHESSTLEAVIQARQGSIAAQGPRQEAQADNILTGALRQLFALAESYPDLKANTSFLNLQEELSQTENKIGYSRQFYNDSVLKYNTKIQQFPTLVVAKPFGFDEREYFEAEDAAREAPRVQF